ncbi:MAG TPA: hypothetical protein VHE54_20205 [Puia sp.]|nr:hypothetical protein [Puia sp.]
MSSKLSQSSRAAVFLSSLAMVAVLSLPIWRIELSAPQYPEGLVMKIYSDRIGGDVDVVNGLNHYIGMHTLHTRDFVEFLVLPYIIGGFAALGLLVTLVGRKTWFYGWVVVFLLIAFTSMIDFYRWEYNYGHNLDPAAPIQVPGMAYQPPLIGYKQLLNFGAYSIPDAGGWIFVGVGLALAGIVIFEWRRSRKVRPLPAGAVAPVAVPMVVVMAFCMSSCQTGPQDIRFGQDNCDFCKMAFSDRHFGAEVTTGTGKVYKFDDIHCLLESLKAGVPRKTDIAGIYLIDYNGGPWVKATAAALLRSENLHTPMNGNIAAFANAAARDAQLNQLKGQPVTWQGLYR